MYFLEFRVDVGEAGIPLVIVPYNPEEGHPYYVFRQTARDVEHTLSYDVAVITDARHAPLVYIERTGERGGYSWSLYKPADFVRYDKGEIKPDETTRFQIDTGTYDEVMDMVFFHLFMTLNVPQVV